MMHTYPLDKLLSVFIDDTSGELDLPEANVLIHLLRVLRVERAPATAHFEKEHPEAPEVHQFGVPMFIEEYFWRQVFSGATKRVGELIGTKIGFRQAEVTQCDVPCSVQEDVLRL